MSPDRTHAEERGVPIAAALSPGTYISELRDAEDKAEAARQERLAKRLRRVRRCEAYSRRTGGACDEPLDSHGYCPRPSDHAEEGPR